MRGFRLELRPFVRGLVGAIVLVAAAFGALRSAGFPWNLMRNQPGIEPMERPFVPVPANTRPFAAGGWPALGQDRDTFPRETDLRAAAALYRRNCRHCHGESGRGDGPVAQSLRQRPADLGSWSVQLLEPESLHRLIGHPRSIMPAFAGRLTGPERGLLVRYLQHAFRPPAAEPGWRDSGQSGARLGERIYRELDCARCHGPRRTEWAPGLPPSLAFAGNKLEPEWVERYLRTPHPIRYERQGVVSELRMPRYRLTAPEAAALATYLAGERQDGLFEDSGADWGRSTADEIDEGRLLFKEYACQGCHQLRGVGNRVGPDLTRVGSRLQPEYIYHFIRDPKRYISNTPMKDNDLWPEEAEAITRFLDGLE